MGVTEEQGELAQRFWEDALEDGGVYATSCLCGARMADSVVLAETDRFGVPVRTLVCECGTVRSDSALGVGWSDNFYRSGLYRMLHPGAGDLVTRVARDSAKGQWLSVNAHARLSGMLAEIGAGTGMAARVLSSLSGCDGFIPVDADPVHESFGQDVLEDIEDLGVILAIHVLEHMRDPVETLREWASHMRPGGDMIVVVPNLWEIHRHRFVVESGDPREWLQFAHVWNWDEQTVRIPFQAAGLSVKHVFEAPPGALATVGSIVVEARVERRAELVRQYFLGGAM